MPQYPTIDKVSCQYGAPFGRDQWWDTPLAEVKPKSVHLFSVPIVHGYDSGGAYWGMPSDVFCATDCEGYRMFARARSRRNAAKSLGLTSEKLIRKT